MNVLPAKLQSIHFSDEFNQPIEMNVLPAKLQSVHFGDKSNQPINKDVLPKGLLIVEFGSCFNQPIETYVLPERLHSIYFGIYFNQLIDNISRKTKVYLRNIPKNETRNYTIYGCDKSNLEKMIQNKNIGEIYRKKIYNIEYYMADVEIIKSEIIEP